MGRELAKEVAVDLGEKEMLNSARTLKGALDCQILLMCETLEPFSKNQKY